jgi:hypothetical protein
MKRMLTRLLGRLGFVPNEAVRHVIAPAASAVQWSVADGRFWARVLATPTWSKLASMSEDSMIQGLLPRAAPYRDEPALQQAFVLGRKMQLDYLVSMAAPADGGNEPASGTAEMIFENEQ